MSIASQIDRINGEVSSQSTIIDEISTILDTKASGNPNLQEKTVTPSLAQQEVMPDAEYDGLSKVIVNGDSNLVSENIKEGVNIFGVEGSLKSGAEWKSLASIGTSDYAVQPRVGDPTWSYSFDLVFDTLPAVILLKEDYLSDVTFCGARISQTNPVDSFEKGGEGDGWIHIIDSVVTESDGKFNVKIEYEGHSFSDVYYMILPYE